MTNSIKLTPISTFTTGIFDEGAAEINAYDANSQRLFVVNANDNSLDVLDLSNPSNPTLITQISLASFGGGANSVTVKHGLVAVAVANDNTQEPGEVVFLDINGNFLNSVTVGALPDMVTFSPDGNKVLVANEGEPSDDYTVDPEGSISIIDLSYGVNNATVTTADFKSFNPQIDELRQAGVRIFGPGATVAQDLEPEFITVSPDSQTAYATLQENNAIAIIDLHSGTVTDIVPLGFKDHSLPGNALDPSNEDGGINIQNLPVFGMFQPDSITSYEVDGKTYLVTANEGDARDYDGFSEEVRVEDIVLDPYAFPNAAQLQKPENLGRLKVTNTLGDTDGDGDFDQLFAFGGRSFSILDEDGNFVFDSGDDFERITALFLPEEFNSTNDENGSFDNRSDDKGPEPEGVVVGIVDERSYAFIGLERIGGVMVYDVTNPNQTFFVQYINTRDFSGDAVAGTAGDLGPEGLTFISAEDSPNGEPLLAVSNEVSGSTTLFAIDTDFSPQTIVGDDKNNNLVGTFNNDFIYGFGGDDKIDGGDGDDFIQGGEGNDLIDGGYGFDILNGGDGIDTVDYDFYYGGIVANLNTGEVSFPGNSTQTDTLISIENIIGTKQSDTLIGDNDHNILIGSGGDDYIEARSGDDIVYGDGVAKTIFTTDFEEAPDGIWFTDSPLDGWYSSDGYIEYRNDGAAEGSKYIELNEDPLDYYQDASQIYREIATEAHQSYQLTFQYSPRAGYSADVNAIEVRLDGETLLAVAQDGSHNTGNVWQTYTVEFEGDGTTQHLEFLSTGTPVNYGRGGRIDDIELTTYDDTLGDNLVINGSFEDNYVAPGNFAVFHEIPGWTTTFGQGIQVDRRDTFGTVADGDAFVELDSYHNSGMVSHVDTNANESYLISFDYSARPGISADSTGIEVYWNHILLDTIAAEGEDSNDWQTYTYEVEGSHADTTALEFRATGISDYYGGFLDDVKVQEIKQGGKDTLIGNRGNDSLYGGIDDDILAGNRDSDILTGGSGYDKFVFAEENSLLAGEFDVITDFQPEVDLVEFQGFGTIDPDVWFDDVVAQGKLVDTDEGTLFTAPQGGQLLLAGVELEDLSGADFAFV